MNDQLETTTEAQTPQLDAIDRATLTPLVQSALNSETIQVTDWTCEQLHAGVGEWSAIYRFTGHGHDQAKSVPWSLILKVLRPHDMGANPSSWNYYRREADAYQSGWLDDLPGGLAAPRCFDVVEHSDGTCWIWLEDVTDEIGAQWPLEHYGVVARHLGQFNGAYLVDRPLPSWPWLSSGWLREYVEQNAATMPRIRDSLDHPLVRRLWPGDASERQFRLWEDREHFLGALDCFPRTICHRDAFRRNLFARKTGDGGFQTLAIDWAYAGQGAAGEELVPLVVGSAALFEVDLAQFQTLEDIVFDGYLEGLRDAGWKGDPRQVRLGYLAGSIRYRFAELWRFLAMILDEDLHGFYEQAFGRPVGEVLDYWAQGLSVVDNLTDEARELMDALD